MMIVFILFLEMIMIKFFRKLFRKIFYLDLKNFYVHCYLISKDVGVLQEYLEKNEYSDAARKYIIEAKYNFSKMSPLYYKIIKLNTNKYENKTQYCHNKLITINKDGSDKYEFFTGVKFSTGGWRTEFYANALEIYFDGEKLPFTKFENKLFRYTFKFQEHYASKLKDYRTHEKVQKTLNADF